MPVLSTTSAQPMIDKHRKPVQFAILAVVVSATIAHATLVLLTNSPHNALKSAAAPVFRIYHGPFIDQGWSLFAPNLPNENAHVIVRGKTTRGVLTPWLDVSRFFDDESRSNRFTVLRPISEGFYHATSMLTARKRGLHSLEGVIIENTSAMVLCEYYKTASFQRMELEIDEYPISLSSRRLDEPTRSVRFGWLPFPSVGTV